MNIVFAGGDTSVSGMVASTPRGILVTRLWYIREVDPYEKIFTGMTRDGTFLVEDGQVVAGVRNFRFNVGLMEMLSNPGQSGRGKHPRSSPPLIPKPPGAAKAPFRRTPWCAF